MGDFTTAFVLVFIAELGDKSMLLALAFATRYRVLPVIAGLVTAAFVATGLATFIGAALGTALPEQGLLIGSGLLFQAFGVWLFVTASDDLGETVGMKPAALSGRKFGGYWVVTGGFLLAELGDKTTLATAVLATTQAPVATWLGAGLGMSVTATLAVIVGATIQLYIPVKWISYLAAALFVGFGAVLFIDGVCAAAPQCQVGLFSR